MFDQRFDPLLRLGFWIDGEPVLSMLAAYENGVRGGKDPAESRARRSRVSGKTEVLDGRRPRAHFARLRLKNLQLWMRASPARSDYEQERPQLGSGRS